VILGEVPTVSPQMTGDFGTLMGWVDSFRTMKVRTNADTPHDSKVAREFGLKGSASAAPSICSSKLNGSLRYGR